MGAAMTIFSIETRPLQTDAAPGVDALVDAIALLGGGEPDEAAVLSGAAFRTYYLTPDDNHAYKEVISPREWAWGSLEVENYGVLESLATHLDRDLRLWSFQRPADLAALARVELEAGRPLLLGFGHEPTRLVLANAIEVGPRRFALEHGADPNAAGVAEPDRFGFGELERWREDDVRPRYALTVRAGVEPASARRRELLRRDVLTFAGRHARSRKELSYSEELFYASGLRAWEVAAESLVERWRPEDAEAFDPFWRAWSQSLRRARTAAAQVLDRWSADEPALAEAARAYSEVADAVPVVSGAVEWTDYILRSHLADALRAGADRDAAALAALARAVENFEPLE
jgi:hypothetical protein